MIARISVSLLLFVGTLAASPAWSQGRELSTHFHVSGDVERKISFDLNKLRALPATTANVTYFASGQVVNATFYGALLWDVLRAAGIKVDPAIRNDILRKFVVVTGTDGYHAVFGVGELDPRFGGAQIVVAYGQNGQLTLGEDGFARIVAPGDKQGGRFVSNIVKIEVHGTDDVNDRGWRH